MLAVTTSPLGDTREFAESLQLEFPVLADEAGSVTREYGVLNEEGRPDRTTFVIARDRTIVHVERGVSAIDSTGVLRACSQI